MCAPCRPGLRSKKLMCSICQLPVRGLGTSCLVCAHSMHLDCLHADASISTTSSSSAGVVYRCPSGCGCRCVEAGGLHGCFETQGVVPTAAVAGDGRGVGAADQSPTPPPPISQETAASKSTLGPASSTTTAAAAPTSGFALAKARIRNLAADSFATWG